MRLKHLIYLHGFLSSPASTKARQTQTFLVQHHADIAYHCPTISPYPDVAYQTLTDLIHSLTGSIGLIGSSLGGFWATVLSERYQFPAVLINPAVNVSKLIPKFEYQHISNYYTDESYWLTAEHSQQLLSYQCEHIHPEYYWLLAQMNDQTLDYRTASKYYHGSRQTIEPGGNHSFVGYDRYLESIVRYLSE